MLKYKNHIGVRGSQQTDELLENLEPELGIEYLISELVYNNLYLSESFFEKFAWIVKNLRLENNYLQAIQNLYVDKDYLIFKFKTLLIRMNLPVKTRYSLLAELLNKKTHDFFELFINEICINNFQITSEQYREIIRLSYLIDTIYPSICLKINGFVPFHIENNEPILNKTITLINEFKNDLPESYFNLLFEYIKYDEMESCLDSLCELLTNDNKKITQQTYDRIMEIA